MEVEDFSEDQKALVYDIIGQPNQTPTFQHLISIICGDEELVGIMVRNAALLSALHDCDLEVGKLLALLTAGEEDGRKCSPI